jgi:Ca-activated chloride channel family protein
MLRLLICLFLLFSFADADLFAQKGDDYFHSGSLAFLTGDREKAKSEVERGLRIDPENSKLLALQAELDQEEENRENQQQQRQEGASGENQSEESEQNRQQAQDEEKDTPAKPGNDTDQQNNQEEQTESGSDEENQAEQMKQGSEGQNDSIPGKEGEANGANEESDDNRRRQLSKEAALQLLRALENAEEEGLIIRRPLPSNGQKKEKDW